MKKAPETNRKTKGYLSSDKSYGNNGVFIFEHYRILDYEIKCIISDGEGWEHVSVDVARKNKEPTRCPTWEEMCWVKDQFWNKDECVIQFHPVESEYVNHHPFVLHLWKPTEQVIPTPHKLMV